MKFYIDSAKIDEIQYALDMWSVDGVTSNPRHICSSGKPFLTAIRDIAALAGDREIPISVEVNPHHLSADAMVAEALPLAAMSKNFVIKIPATELGFKALALLHSKGIRVNLTLVFSPLQALQAARLGAAYVSPFVGWKESTGEEASSMVKNIVAIYQNYSYNTKIIVAAVRNARQIVEAAMVGADIVTAGFDVYKEAFSNPYTELGLKRFSESWDATPYR